MAEKKERLDVAQVAKRDLTETAFPGGKQDFRVFFDRKIHERIAAHAAEKLSLEICGVLVGQWHRDAYGPFVLVNESIRCDKAVSNAGDVKLTHEDWSDVNREMDTKFTDRAIVGWYHSHPNYGIFLSEHDRFIQEYTFNAPGHIAYVVDPVNGVEGVFAWRDGKSILWPHFWVGDEIHLSSEGTGRTPSSVQPAGQSPAAAPKPAAPPLLSPSMTWLLAAACFLMLGYLLGGCSSAADRALTTQAAVTHYGVFKGLKLGMREAMDKVTKDTQMTAQRAIELGKEHISSLTGDAQEEKKKQWSEVLQSFQVILVNLQTIRQFYGLTDEEAAEVQELMRAKLAATRDVQNQAAEDSAAADSGAKTTAAKPSAEPAKPTAAPVPAPVPAPEAKPTAAPAPAKPPEAKPVESNPAETSKPADTSKTPASLPGR